jgi:hypothetical protein
MVLRRAVGGSSDSVSVHRRDRAERAVAASTVAAGVVETIGIDNDGLDILPSAAVADGNDTSSHDDHY